MELTDRPRLARRDFFRTGLATMAGFYLQPMLRPLNVQAKEPVKPRGAAEYCVFLFLNGGAPQLDTWDLKEGRWTPPEFDVRTVKPGILWPYGQFPKLATQLDRVALARSTEAWENAHARAQYYMQVGHIFSPPRANEMPSVGSVVASEFASRRLASDFLPPFVAINFGAAQAGLIKLSELIDSTLDDGELIDTSALPQPSREEIQRRLNSIVDGTAVSYTVQETMVHLRSRTWREGQS